LLNTSMSFSLPSSRRITDIPLKFPAVDPTTAKVVPRLVLWKYRQCCVDERQGLTAACFASGGKGLPWGGNE